MKHFTFLLACAFVIISCKKEKDPDPKPNPPAPAPSSYTINGDGFNNKLFDFEAPYESRGVLSVGANNTSLYIKELDGTDTNSITVSFNGKVPWEYSFGGMTGMSIGFKKQNGTQTFYASKSGNGKIIVESYGAVGEHIKGTFSGTFFNPFTSATVTISNGRFDVIRQADKP